MRFLLDSSSVIAMARAGKLELLRRIVGKAHVTEAVRAEVLARNDETTAVIRLALGAWISTLPTPRVEAETLRLGLNVGEASLIAAAARNDVLVIDEKQGRALANSMGFVCVGTLGLLAAAVRDRILDAEEARGALEALEQAGFWLSPHLRNQFLRELEASLR